MWYLVTKIAPLLTAAFGLGAVFGRLLPRRNRPAGPGLVEGQPAEAGLGEGPPTDEPIDLTDGDRDGAPPEPTEPEPTEPEIELEPTELEPDPEIQSAPDFADPVVDSVDDSVFAVLGQTLSAGAGAPAGGEASEPSDDLKQIFGIGPRLEQLLLDYGITRLEQLAGMDQDGIDELQSFLTEFPDRVERDDWVGQARRLIE